MLTWFIASSSNSQINPGVVESHWVDLGTTHYHNDGDNGNEATDFMVDLMMIDDRDHQSQRYKNQQHHHYKHQLDHKHQQ